MGSNEALKDTSCHLNDSTKPNELWSPLQWWVIQGFFWLSLSAITFFTLTVWYATIEWPHILHTLLQAEHQKVLEASARSLQAEALARVAQLEMLRYQLNPHFLFNTLNAVSALVRLSDSLTKQVNFA